MIFEDGKIDHRGAGAGEEFGETRGDGAVCVCRRSVFEADVFGVGAEDAFAIGIGGHFVANTIEFAIDAIPDDDIVGLDAGLLEAFADGVDENDVVERPGPAMVLTLRPTTSPGFTTFFQAATGSRVSKKDCMAVSRSLCTRAGVERAIRGRRLWDRGR